MLKKHVAYNVIDLTAGVYACAQIELVSFVNKHFCCSEGKTSALFAKLTSVPLLGLDGCPSVHRLLSCFCSVLGL